MYGRASLTRRAFVGIGGTMALAGCLGGTRLSTLAAERADYYVSPDGNDGSTGTKSNPLRTIRAAIGKATQGDLIYVRGGTYDQSSRIEIWETGGTQDRPIRLVGYPGERPIVSGDQIWVSQAAHWHIENFEIRNSGTNGVMLLSSDHITLKNLDVHHHSESGVLVYDSPENRLVNVTSHHNHDVSTGGQNADGIDVVGGDSKGNLVYGANTFWNSDDGIDLWKGGPTTIRRSVSWNNGLDKEGNGNGFKLSGGEPDTGGHTLERSVAFGNRHRGVDLVTSTIPCKLYNNTAWNNQIDVRVSDAPHELRNNLSDAGQVLVENVVDDRHNSWNLDITRPRFASVDPASGAFLRLSKGSPAIDAGVDVGLEYAGAAPDLGAFEFQQS